MINFPRIAFGKTNLFTKQNDEIQGKNFLGCIFEPLPQ